MNNKNNSHSKNLEILQTKYNPDIIDYTRITSKVILLHVSKVKYDNLAGFSFEKYYNLIAVQNGEKFSIKKTHFGNVTCDKNGIITAESKIFGITKKCYFDKKGKRIFKAENNN